MVTRRLLAEFVDVALATAVALVVSKFVAGILRQPYFSWQATDTTYLALYLVSLLCVLATLPLAMLWHRAEPTPGYRIFGLKLRDRGTWGVLSRMAASARWIVLFAPITLWVCPTIAQTAFDHTPFLDLIVLPDWLYQLMLVPVIWYVLLTVSTVRSRDGRGWHDRVSGAVASRAVAAVRTSPST